MVGKGSSLLWGNEGKNHGSVDASVTSAPLVPDPGAMFLNTYVKTAREETSRKDGDQGLRMSVSRVQAKGSNEQRH